MWPEEVLRGCRLHATVETLNEWRRSGGGWSGGPPHWDSETETKMQKLEHLIIITRNMFVT